MGSMEPALSFSILPQPDDSTCGPTCLHALYHYYGDDLPLEQVIQETRSLKEGGTLDVFLGVHALKRGYRATIYTYNLRIFDPTWFEPSRRDIAERLRAMLEVRDKPKLRLACKGYLEFLELGGEVRFEDLTTGLIRRYLRRGHPILTGLSSTYLYRCAREYGPKSDYDDLRGDPTGHFVVLCGYRKEERLVQVADPWFPNPMAPGQLYETTIDRVIGSILLGVITYDANLLIIEPPLRSRTRAHVDTDSR